MFICIDMVMVVGLVVVVGLERAAVPVQQTRAARGGWGNGNYLAERAVLAKVANTHTNTHARGSPGTARKAERSKKVRKGEQEKKRERGREGGRAHRKPGTKKREKEQQENDFEEAGAVHLRLLRLESLHR